MKYALCILLIALLSCDTAPAEQSEDGNVDMETYGVILPTVDYAEEIDPSRKYEAIVVMDSSGIEMIMDSMAYITNQIKKIALYADTSVSIEAVEKYCYNLPKGYYEFDLVCWSNNRLSYLRTEYRDISQTLPIGGRLFHNCLEVAVNKDKLMLVENEFYISEFNKDSIWSFYKGLYEFDKEDVFKLGIMFNDTSEVKKIIDNYDEYSNYNRPTTEFFMNLLDLLITEGEVISYQRSPVVFYNEPENKVQWLYDEISIFESLENQRLFIELLKMWKIPFKSTMKKFGKVVSPPIYFMGQSENFEELLPPPLIK